MTDLSAPYKAVDPQDPVPEGSWLWRRLLTFCVTFVALGLLAFGIFRADPQGIPGIAYGLISLIALYATLYLVAPSADELARIVARLSHLKLMSLPNITLPAGTPPMIQNAVNSAESMVKKATEGDVSDQ